MAVVVDRADVEVDGAADESNTLPLVLEDVVVVVLELVVVDVDDPTIDKYTVR